MGTDADARLGEAALQRGLIDAQTLRGALDALDAERARGRQRTLPLYLFETGAIDAVTLMSLLELEKSVGLSASPFAPTLDWTSETLPLPTPPVPVAPPPPPVAPRSTRPTPRATPAPPPAAPRSTRPTPRAAQASPPAPSPAPQATWAQGAPPPRVPVARPAPRPSLRTLSVHARRPIAVLVFACAVGAILFGISLGKKASDNRRREDLAREFDRAAEAARDAYGARDGSRAIEGYRKAVAIGKQYADLARERRWDASRLQARCDEYEAAAARLEKSEARALDVLRDAREAGLLADGGRLPEAKPLVAAGLEKAASYLSAAMSDDPWRVEVIVAQDKLATLANAMAEPPPSPPPAAPEVDDAFMAAYRSMADLTRSMYAGVTPESVGWLRDEVARVRASVRDLQGSIAGEDPRRGEIDSWCRTLDGWDDTIKEVASSPAPPVEQRDPPDEIQNAIDGAMSISPYARPKEALTAIDDALDRIQFYQSTARADDPRLDRLMASAEELLRRRKLAEGVLEGGATVQAPVPPVGGGAPVKPPDPANGGLPDGALDQLAARLRPSVVCVRVMRRGSPEMVVAGSGFIVHKSGYVVTCRHLLDGATSISVAWDAAVGREEVEAKLVRWTLRADVALLKLPPGEYPAIPLSAGQDTVGQPTVVFGCAPRSGTLTVEGAAGRVETAEQAVGAERRLLGLAVSAGAPLAGGVVLDGMSVQALGVAVVASSGPLAGQTWAIPALVLKKEFPSLWSGGGYPAAVAAPEAGTGVGDPKACRTCSGNGKECSSCYGKGQVRVNCPTCGGQGHLEDSRLRRSDCPRCETGTLETKCSVCAGAGVVECKKCGAGSR